MAIAWHSWLRKDSKEDIAPGQVEGGETEMVAHFAYLGSMC